MTPSKDHCCAGLIRPDLMKKTRVTLSFCTFLLHRGLGLVLILSIGTSSGWASPPSVDKVHQAIAKAVGFLQQTQQPDGSFLLYRCQDQELTECIPSYSTRSMVRTPDSPVLSSPATAVVLTGLLAVQDPHTAPLLERGARWLQVQMDEDGWFGHYRLAIPSEGPGCPGEVRSLHTTMINRSLLETIGVSLPAILPELMTYQRADGTFYHFAISPAEVEAITSSPSRQDQFSRRCGGVALTLVDYVDPGANAWVLAYLVKHGQNSKELCNSLVRFAEQDQLPAHPATVIHPYAIPYALSQGYRDGATCLEPAKAALQPRLLEQQRPDGSWGSIVDTALAASSLTDFGYTGEGLDRAIRFLLNQQQPDGRWKRAIRWMHKGPPPAWSGSEEVSTGLVLEALGKYLTVRQPTSLRGRFHP